jgi:glycosyltransferase involved in cell wall biosynthesis
MTPHDSIFPSPPPGKSGWPWTESCATVPPLRPDGSPWPRISIVTPSYNQGNYLEETIRSVLLQQYPNLEYLILDGGSTDNSVEIIRKYEPWLTFWSSGKDGGQVDAINKGLAQCSGEITSWLNSDDLYQQDALRHAAEAFDPEGTHQIVIGERYNISEDGSFINRQTIGRSPVTLFQILYMGRWPFYQESVFFRRELWKKVGGVADTYHLLFDYDFFLRCLSHTTAKTLPGTVLGCWRHHPLQKVNPAGEQLVNEEIAEIYRKYRSTFVRSWMTNILWSVGRRTVCKDDLTITEVQAKD